MNLKKLINGKSKVCDMAQLKPWQTGLTYEVYVSPEVPKHQPRMKVIVRGKDNTVSFLIKDNPEISVGKAHLLSGKEKKEVIDWIILNKDILLNYWNRRISTEELKNNIKKI